MRQGFVRPAFLVCAYLFCHVNNLPAGTPLVVEIDPETEYQTIQGFGASDCWSTQFVGNWPDARRSAIADLLFSTETDSTGKPEGIGLSGWRFNLGAGSARQGQQSGIPDEWRRADSFIRQDGSFDSSAHAGQRWFLRAARKRGVKNFTAFCNSPPVNFTKNGKAYSQNSDSANLRDDCYWHFADYICRAIKLLNKDAPIKFISPVNEPQWNWTNPTQEGSPYTNKQVYRLVATLDSALSLHNLDTKITIPEAGQYTFLPYKETSKPGRDNQIEAFFSPSSPCYLNFGHVAKTVSAHSYYTVYPIKRMIQVRRDAWAKARAIDPSLELEMSEYCILQKTPEIRGSGRDLGMKTALYVARIIHHDLTEANVSSWSWWLAVSPYDFKDGLIYVDKNRVDGNYYDSKTLWALGNFSRFIRPGMKRIGLTRNDNVSGEEAANGLMLSAFSDGRSIVLVAVNYGMEEVAIRPSVRGSDNWRTRLFLTDNRHNLSLQKTQSGRNPVIPARSIATIVLD